MARRGRRVGFQKPKDAKKTFKLLLGYLAKSRWLLLLVFFFVLVSTSGSVASSYFIKIIIDDYLKPMLAGGRAADLHAVLLVLLKMGSVFLVSTAASYAYARIMLQLSQKTVNILRRDLFDAMQDLPISFFDTHTHGDLMSRYTNDVDTVRNFLSQGFVHVVSSSVSLVATFAMMLILSWKLTLFVIVSVLVMVLVIKKIGKKSAFYFKEQQKDLGALNGFIEEMVEGQKVVKVFNHEENARERFAGLNGRLRHSATNAHTFASILMPVLGNLSHLSYAVLATVGGLLCIAEPMKMTIGTLGAFLQYAKSFTDPLVNLSQQFNNVLAALAGAERIFEVTCSEPEKDEGYVRIVNARYDENGELTECAGHTGLWAWKHPHSDGTVTCQKLNGAVDFEHVTFSYDGKTTVLHDISLYAKPGQKIAFVGSTGAGKTTITGLLNRFYEIEQGKIRYDGINIRKIKKDDLRSSLSMVLQDTHLFTGTIADNIRYGRLDATPEQVVEAAKLANADSFITRLPHSYDTVITGDGANLSQGQRQLLAIARAAVADPPVLVLDEATSSVDTRTERLIEKGMDKLMEGRTTFVIAHRLSTVRNADAIMVLENGRIIERGDHEALLAQKGKYYQLYTGQFELT